MHKLLKKMLDRAPFVDRDVDAEDVVDELPETVQDGYEPVGEDG